MSLFGRHQWARTAGTGHQEAQAGTGAPETGGVVSADPEGENGAQEGEER